MCRLRVIAGAPRRRRLAAAALDALERHAILIVCVLAVTELLVGIVVCASLGSQIRFYDEQQYLAIGQHLAHTGSFSIYGDLPTAYRTPGYPIVVWAGQVLGLGTPGVRWLNFVFVALTVVCVYVLTAELASRAAGVLAALLCSAYPLLLFTASTFYPQTLASLLTVVTVLLALKTLRSPTRWRLLLGLLTGLAAGALTMVVPTFAFVPLAVVGWMLIRQGRGAIALCGAVIAGTLLLAAPWTLRNASRFGHFIPLTTSSGFNLLVGNHPGATGAGSYDASAVDPYRAQARRRHLDEYEGDNLLQSVALRWISHHPARAFTLYLGKLVNNFAPSNPLETRGQNSALRSWIAGVTYVPLLLLVMIRLMLVRRRRLRTGEGLLLTLYLGNALLLAAYITRVRYRLPVDTLLIALAAAFLADLLRTAAQRHPPDVPLQPAG